MGSYSVGFLHLASDTPACPSQPACFWSHGGCQSSCQQSCNGVARLKEEGKSREYMLQRCWCRADTTVIHADISIIKRNWHSPLRERSLLCPLPLCLSMAVADREANLGEHFLKAFSPEWSGEINGKKRLQEPGAGFRPSQLRTGTASNSRRGLQKGRQCLGSDVYKQMTTQRG